MMLRALSVIPLALLLSLLLFFVLAKLSGLGAEAPSSQPALTHLDFLQVREESQAEFLQRQRIPRPEEIMPQSKPDLPKLKLDTSLDINMPKPTIEVPDIDMGITLNLAPSLQNLSRPNPTLAFDSNPTALSQIPPQYPRRAQQRQLQGEVTVEFIVTTQGKVKPGSIKVIAATPSGVFEKSVMQAVARWRFQPRIEAAQAVAFRARQTLEFKLER